MAVILRVCKDRTYFIGWEVVILPVMQSELVEKRGWITEEELVEFYALSQSLPGIIAINTSIFVGYKIREEYAKKRIVSQLSQKEKIAKSDIVVENNSTKEEFYKNIFHLKLNLH